MGRMNSGLVGVSLALVFQLSACSDAPGNSSPAVAGTGTGSSSGQGGGGAGAPGGTNSSGGSGAVGGQAPQGGGAQGGSTQGGDQPAPCKVLGDGETGSHGLTRVYHVDETGTFYSPIGVDGGQLYFGVDKKIFAYPIAGGTAKEVGASLGTRQLLHGGKLYGIGSNLGGATAKLLSAPLTDLATTTTLAESLSDPQLFVADDTGVYFDRREPNAIWKVPLAGGAPIELVPGALPLGMISNGGNLYWLEFATNRLQRVPAAGGAPQQLAEVFFGGPMAAAGTTVFWADTSGGSINKWEEGSTVIDVLATSNSAFTLPNYIAVAGKTVYWSLGSNCSEVHQVQTDGTGSALFTQGMYGAKWITVVDGALFAIGRDGLYRATP